MASPPPVNDALFDRARDFGPEDAARRNLLLAFLSYLGAPLSGPDVSERLRERLAPLLERLGWKLVWGPGVFQVVPGAVPANTMFVAEHESTGELFVSIAGTNPFSPYAWFVEDFQVSETRRWEHGDAPETAAVSKGTLKGLLALRGMVPPAIRSEAQDASLESFLASRFAEPGSEVPITVSGHSLGGALSPALGLFLLDSQKDWDPHSRASLSVYAYAGPTPGNDDFARYLNDRFGGRLHRIANPLDVVTRAWNVGDLTDVKALYTPQLARDVLWDKAVDFAIEATNGIRYLQIGRSPQLLPGEVKKELIFRFAPKLLNRAFQVLYQHTVAYFELLGLEYPEPHAELGRHLAGQTDDFARELLGRMGGVGRLLARPVSLGLRLFAETWSRLPNAPALLADPESRDRDRESQES